MNREKILKQCCTDKCNWKNTKAFEPSVEDCPCFPCHKMHFGFNTGNRDEETGGAMCAVKTRPEPLIEDILSNLI